VAGLKPCGSPDYVFEDPPYIDHMPALVVPLRRARYANVFALRRQQPLAYLEPAEKIRKGDVVGKMIMAPPYDLAIVPDAGFGTGGCEAPEGWRHLRSEGSFHLLAPAPGG
jgi:hypothetical protein